MKGNLRKSFQFSSFLKIAVSLQRYPLLRRELETPLSPSPIPLVKIS